MAELVVVGTGGFAHVFNCSSCQPITLAPATLPNITSGVSYSQMLTATGGAAPYSFTVSNGTLPSGLTLSPNGLLSGTSNTQIQYVFTVQATDNNGCTGFRTYALTVIPPCGAITLMPATLPDGFIGNSYNEPLSAMGGTFPYSFTLATGNLPPGLSISSGGSNIFGIPTATGMFSFTVKATDINGCVGTKDYTILIRPPCPSIFIGPNNLPSGTVGAAYNQMLTQTGGMAPITWSVSSGSLPPGLSLDAMTGSITGTPTTATFASFIIRATDANICAAERSYGVSIGAGALQFYPLPRPIRLLDTRANQGNCDNVTTPIAAGGTITTLARITCEGITIPATAQAIVGNITVLNGTGDAGFLTIYPAGLPLPLAANMIYGPGAILANGFTVGLSATGRFNIFGERTIEAIMDVSGYFAP